jgi:hypothetical protein
MKYLKMFGLAVIAAMGLMAFVGAATASAKEGVLCSTTTTPCTAKWPIGTLLDWTLKSGTTFKHTDTNVNTLDTCTLATLRWKVTANPDATGTATGEDTAVILGSASTPCTVTTDIIKLGKWKIAGIPGTHNGLLYSDAPTEITTSIFGSSCNYGMETGAQIGEIIGGEAPSLKVNAVAKKFVGGFLCPETSRLDGEFILTEPTKTPLYVRPS